MMEQMRRLEAIFKWKVVNLDKNDGDYNSFGEYWEVIEPNELEAWSIKLNPMIALTPLSTSLITL
jgi:hypothetical protein